MNKVYGVFSSIRYEGEDMLGLYASEEGAINRIKEIMKVGEWIEESPNCFHDGVQTVYWSEIDVQP